MINLNDIDPRLLSYYNQVVEESPIVKCPGCPNFKQQCVVFISCGPSPKCERPCPKCLFWTGYGLINDSETKECLIWCRNNIKGWKEEDEKRND